MDHRGLCIPIEYYGPLFEEDHFLDIGGDAGNEMGIGDRGKSEKITACDTAAGYPQRPWSAVYLWGLCKSDRRYGTQLFGKNQLMGQCLYRKLPLRDKEGMAQSVPHHRLQPCIQACI